MLALGDNTFYLANSHANSAARVYGVKGYATRLEQMTRLLAAVRAKIADDLTVGRAQAVLDQFAAAVQQAMKLLSDARALLDQKGHPSIAFYQRDTVAPPAGIDAESWQLAWYVDLDKLGLYLPRLDDLANRADQLIDVAAATAKAAEGKKWVAAPVGTIDWSKGEEFDIDPKAKAIGKAAADAAGKAAKFSAGLSLAALGIVAVIAVAGLLLWRGGGRGK